MALIDGASSESAERGQKTQSGLWPMEGSPEGRKQRRKAVPSILCDTTQKRVTTPTQQTIHHQSPNNPPTTNKQSKNSQIISKHSSQTRV